MPKFKPVKGGRPTGRSRTYSASRTRSYYKQYMRPGKRIGYSTVPRTMGVYAQGEMKYFDTERTQTAIPASVDWTGTEFPPNVGTPDTLFSPTVGSAINQRIGREVKVHKIKIKGIITCAAQTNQTGGDTAATVRLALVEDQQTNGTQAQGENIFAAPTTAAAQNSLNAFQSLANFGRFRVLKDKFFTLQNPNMSFDGTNIEQHGLAKPFKFTINFKTPVSVRFNAVNGGTLADIVNNSWCVYATALSTNLAPAITYQARVAYKE